MNTVQIWHTTQQGVHYSARIDGGYLELTRDTGTPESFGAKRLLARHFLQKERWQTLVKQQFGDAVFTQIYQQLAQHLDKHSLTPDAATTGSGPSAAPD